MAQFQIPLNDDLLHGLFQGYGGVARLLEEVLNQILQTQVTEQLQAAPYERTHERQGYRNGTYPHTLTTRVGRLTLRVPRIRGGSFSTELLLRYQPSEQALMLALMKMVIQGVSTRKIAQITGELRRHGVLQVHGLGPVQASGCGGAGMERASLERASVSLCSGG